MTDDNQQELSPVQKERQAILELLKEELDEIPRSIETYMMAPSPYDGNGSTPSELDEIPTAAIASDSAVPEYTDYGLFEMDEGDELVRRKDVEEAIE